MATVGGEMAPMPTFGMEAREVNDTASEPNFQVCPCKLLRWQACVFFESVSTASGS